MYCLSFDPSSFINIVIGGVVGAAGSWIVTHLYWIKSAPTERILKEIKRARPEPIRPIRFPELYAPGAVEITPVEKRPSDTDTPHVLKAKFPKSEFSDGEIVDVLMELLDTGRNLDNPGGITVLDPGKKELPVKFAALGLAHFRLQVKKSDDQPNPVLTVQLADTANHKNTQTIPVTIKSR